ncbi:MAG: hypothetical protein R6U61_06725 [Thermoplasmata archaeon]
MGKSVPTFRQELDSIIAEWSKFRRALRKEERERFDELMTKAKRHASAAQYQANSDPMESVFISILLEHELVLDRLERRLKDEGMDIGHLPRLEKGEDGPLDPD